MILATFGKMVFLFAGAAGVLLLLVSLATAVSRFRGTPRHASVAVAPWLAVGLFFVILCALAPGLVDNVTARVSRSRTWPFSDRIEQMRPAHPDTVGLPEPVEIRDQVATLRAHAREMLAEFGSVASEAAAQVDDSAGDEWEASTGDEFVIDEEAVETATDPNATPEVEAERARIAGVKAKVAQKQLQIHRSGRASGGSRGGWTVSLGFITVAFLYVGYLFLDAATRGHFTWRLRLACVVAVVAMLLAFFTAD